MEDDEEEEFPELVHLARERARLKASEGESLGGGQPTSSSQVLDIPSAAADPILQIFVTSPIPETQPLIVKRKLSQRLREVRLAWCAHQGFPEDFTEKVFFTYRGVRIFDVTSCKALNIRVDDDGTIWAPGDRGQLAEADTDGKLHLEATTEEIQRLSEKDKFLLNDSGEDGSDLEVISAKEAPKEKTIKLFLKSKGYDDFKLQVKPVCSPLIWRGPQTLVPLRSLLGSPPSNFGAGFNRNEDDKCVSESAKCRGGQGNIPAF